MATAVFQRLESAISKRRRPRNRDKSRKPSAPDKRAYALGFNAGEQIEAGALKLIFAWDDKHGREHTARNPRERRP